MASFVPPYDRSPGPSDRRAPLVDELGYQLAWDPAAPHSTSSIYDHPAELEVDEYFRQLDDRGERSGPLDDPDDAFVRDYGYFEGALSSPTPSPTASTSRFPPPPVAPHPSSSQQNQRARPEPQSWQPFGADRGLSRSSTLPPSRASQPVQNVAPLPLVRPNPIRPMPVLPRQPAAQTSQALRTSQVPRTTRPAPTLSTTQSTRSTFLGGQAPGRSFANQDPSIVSRARDGGWEDAGHRIAEIDRDEAEYWQDDDLDALAQEIDESRGRPLATASTHSTTAPQRQQNTSTQSTMGPDPFEIPNSSKQRAVYNASIAPVVAKRGIRLKPVSDLPDAFRSIWRFGVFNAVQSHCFDAVYLSDTNLVVSAPTGAGKTVLFELAILRLFTTSPSSSSKVLYMAPTKSLCAERAADWRRKFEIGLGWGLKELTGDSETGSGTWREIAKARIIVTTPEKWDAITRRWHDHDQMLSQLQLFCIDEVHSVGADVRGAVLEVVVSRMKTLGTSTRFVAVSATVPNIVDVSEWLRNSTDHSPATVFQFGDDFRPCPLQKIVLGYNRGNSNDFAFGNTLNFRLFEVIKQYSSGKPVLIFCPTRKACLQAAEQLVKEYRQSTGSAGARQRLAWPKPPRTTFAINDKRLSALIENGAATHHAGMDQNDRKLVEKLFVDGRISIVCSTSTLAVGVNLPARMVVIRGTRGFFDGRSADYPDMEILQMLGRAGRPQFDNVGIACILTDKDSQARYENLVNAQKKLESCLHKNLIEHINSEISLNTIDSVDSALRWLRSTFLYVRIVKNPGYYAIANGTKMSPDERLEEICVEAIKELVSEGIVSQGEDEKLVANDYGEIMSRFYISHSTFVALKSMTNGGTMRTLLETLCKAEDFASFRFRQGEKGVLARFNKVMILIQLVLEGVSGQEVKTETINPMLDVHTIWPVAIRIVKSMVDLAILRKDGSVRFAMELLRSLNGRCWDGTSFVLRQLNGIGEKSYKALVEAGIRSFADVCAASPDRLELILNRKPPYGSTLVKQARTFPTFELELTIDREQVHDVGVEVEITVGISLKQTKPPPVVKKGIIRLYASVLLYTNDGHFIEFRRCPLEQLVSSSKEFYVSVVLIKPSQRIIVAASCDALAGSEVRAETKPTTKASEFPIPSLSSDPTVNENPGVIVQAPPPREQKASTSKTVPKRPAANVVLDEDEGENVDPKIRMREDGRYDCNHSCNDKSKCKHLCCREGLDKPPKTTKATNKKRKLSVESRVPEPASKKRLPIAPSGGVSLVIGKAGKAVTAKAAVEAEGKDEAREASDDVDDLADYELPTLDQLDAAPTAKQKRLAGQGSRKVVIPPPQSPRSRVAYVSSGPRPSQEEFTPSPRPRTVRETASSDPLDLIAPVRSSFNKSILAVPRASGSKWRAKDKGLFLRDFASSSPPSDGKVAVDRDVDARGTNDSQGRNDSTRREQGGDLSEVVTDEDPTGSVDMASFARDEEMASGDLDDVFDFGAIDVYKGKSKQEMKRGKAGVGTETFGDPQTQVGSGPEDEGMAMDVGESSKDLAEGSSDISGPDDVDDFEAWLADNVEIV
ncbi:hypothetical protein JCM10212_001766 [Sporobolomyces blumeae]